MRREGGKIVIASLNSATCSTSTRCFGAGNGASKCLLTPPPPPPPPSPVAFYECLPRMFAALSFSSPVSHTRLFATFLSLFVLHSRGTVWLYRSGFCFLYIFFSHTKVSFSGWWWLFAPAPPSCDYCYSSSPVTSPPQPPPTATTDATAATAAAAAAALSSFPISQ